jgi:hypothetical protein
LDDPSDFLVLLASAKKVVQRRNIHNIVCNCGGKANEVGSKEVATEAL